MIITLVPVPGSLSVTALFRNGSLLVNGQLHKPDSLPEEGPVRRDPKGIYVEYGEQAGCVTSSDTMMVKFHRIPSTWIDPTPPPVVEPEPEVNLDPVPDRCSKLQGILAVGFDRWKVVQDFASHPETDWRMRVIIDNTLIWYRTSEEIAFFAFMMGLSPSEVDDMFRLAVTL